LKTADEVANNLKDRYKDQWIDPKDDRNSEWVQKDDWKSWINCKWKKVCSL
jgi:hypothetical protein